MAKVKINNGRYAEMISLVSESMELMQEAINIWLDHFADIAQAYGIPGTPGFIEDLYKDAESNWIAFRDTCGIVGAASGVVASGLAIAAATAPTGIGAIIGLAIAAIGLVLGIVVTVIDANTVQFKYEARDAFLMLLWACLNGEDDTFYVMQNMYYRISDILVAFQEIGVKVNEFQHTYANLNAAAQELGVETVLASDGTTLLGIETAVTIDGASVKMTTSEALNAFYTYSNTIMSTEISADYLHRTYGYDIDYNDIIKNANAFMTKTISSGLYTHEFIQGVLPEFDPIIGKAYEAAETATGVKFDELQNSLNNNASILGNVTLYAGLVGSAFMGKLSGGKNNNSSGGGSGNGSGGSGGNGNGSGGSGGSGNGSGSGDNGGKTEVKPSNNVEISSIVESKLPTEVKFEDDKTSVVDKTSTDFDEEAKLKFEFEGEYEDKISLRDEIINDVQSKFESGDFDSLRKQLKEYGYSDSDIELILQDKLITMKAIMAGEQNANLAAQARELAKLAGIDDYTSKYDTPLTYDDLNSDEPNRNFMLASEDSGVTKLYQDMKSSKTMYQATIVATNAILTQVGTNKTAMEDMFNKYSKEFGSDTTKWTEKAALEYKAAVDKYNSSVDEANKQMDKLKESKDKYKASRDDFEKAREKYYMDTIENYRKSKKESSGSVEVPEASAADVKKQIEDSIKFDGDSIAIDGVGTNPGVSNAETLNAANPAEGDVAKQIEDSINISVDGINIG